MCVDPVLRLVQAPLEAEVLAFKGSLGRANETFVLPSGVLLDFEWIYMVSKGYMISKSI